MRVQVLQFEQELSRQDRSKNKDPSLKQTWHVLRINKKKTNVPQTDGAQEHEYEGKDTVINQIMKVLIGHGRPTLYTNSESSKRTI